MTQLQRISIAVAALITALGSGCASLSSTQPGVLANLIDEANNSRNEFNANLEEARPSYLEPYIAENNESGLRDQVLINMTAGVEALQHGDYHITRRLMEDAYNRIETIYADNENAEAARSKFAEEANKDFKGEPYERAMVGYYLGLTDMIEDDLQSAKSSFGWGEYQDTLTAHEEFQADMNSLVFLRGWARQCAGEHSSAREDFESSGIVPNENDNLLVLIETGQGPIKYSEGEHNEVLKFKSSSFDVPVGVKVNYNNRYFEPTQIEDLVFQATTRGGRAFDDILEGKANFKDTAENISDTTLALGVASTMVGSTHQSYGDYDSANTAGALGLAFTAISLFSQIAADQTTPAADTRQWNNLPRYLHAKTLNYKAGDAIELAVESQFGKTVIEPQETGKCYLAWHRVEH